MLIHRPASPLLRQMAAAAVDAEAEEVGSKGDGKADTKPPDEGADGDTPRKPTPDDDADGAKRRKSPEQWRREMRRQLALDLRNRLSLSQHRHEEAARHFSQRFFALSIPTVCLAASVAIVEAVFQDAFAKKVAIITIGALNTVLLTVANMKAYQSLKDRHAEAAQTYAGFVSQLDFQVIFPTRNNCWVGMEETIDAYLQSLTTTVKDLSTRVPPVGLRIEANTIIARERLELKRKLEANQGKSRVLPQADSVLPEVSAEPRSNEQPLGDGGGKGCGTGEGGFGAGAGGCGGGPSLLSSVQGDVVMGQFQGRPMLNRGGSFGAVAGDPWGDPRQQVMRYACGGYGAPSVMAQAYLGGPSVNYQSPDVAPTMGAGGWSSAVDPDYYAQGASAVSAMGGAAHVYSSVQASEGQPQQVVEYFEYAPQYPGAPSPVGRAVQPVHAGGPAYSFSPPPLAAASSTPWTAFAGAPTQAASLSVAATRQTSAMVLRQGGSYAVPSERYAEAGRWDGPSRHPVLRASSSVLEWPEERRQQISAIVPGSPSSCCYTSIGASARFGPPEPSFGTTAAGQFPQPASQTPLATPQAPRLGAPLASAEAPLPPPSSPPSLSREGVLAMMMAEEGSSTEQAPEAMPPMPCFGRSQEDGLLQ